MCIVGYFLNILHYKHKSPEKVPNLLFAAVCGLIGFGMIYSGKDPDS
jgi:hypothetical protein